MKALIPLQYRTLPFEEAAGHWLEIKKLHSKKPRTIEMYEWYIRNLQKFFSGVLLSQMHIGHFLEYQRQRRLSAGPSCINHELNTLAQILKMADLWDLIEKHYKALPVPNWTPPKVLTAEEEERFFRVAAGNPDWSIAYWAASLTNNTSAMGIELRYLQMKHIFLEQEPPTIHIPDAKVKNEFRARVVPLNAVAAKQVRRILERAKQLGAWHPDHYVFPFRVKRGSYDISRPASPYFLRSAFRSMRKITGLNWLQPRNFRNQVITKLFESGAPDETIMSIAGHQSIKMSRYYSRIRITAKAEALDAICPGQTHLNQKNEKPNSVR
ncbi:MAG TPA: tyrosine-type recombinase/integrase [Candidatus Angelobacter sp.]|nr:tyrosine-type recombinase/integrase [Candidatus Angelobacter sp.]